MKNYKFILIIFITLVAGSILVISSFEMPAPQKKITKSLDVNDASVK